MRNTTIKSILGLSLLLAVQSCGTEPDLTLVKSESMIGKVSHIKLGETENSYSKHEIYVQNEVSTHTFYLDVANPINYKVGDTVVLLIETYKEKSTN